MDYGRREFLGLAAAGVAGYASAKAGLSLPKADVFVAGAAGRKVKDLAGSARISGERVDIGCYERYFPLGLMLMFE